MRKDAKEVYEYALSLGFEEVRYTGHYHMQHPNGARVTFSGTARDRRAKQNAMADIRRALRQHEERKDDQGNDNGQG